MVHKSGHHFDLVNWWLASSPVQVAGMGSLAFYGSKNGSDNGWRKDYKRTAGSEEAKNDPFAIFIDKDPLYQKLYGEEAHGVDGYERDRNVS
jgi:hypothetical protein